MTNNENEWGKTLAWVFLFMAVYGIIRDGFIHELSYFQIILTTLLSVAVTWFAMAYIRHFFVKK